MPTHLTEQRCWSAEGVNVFSTFSYRTEAPHPFLALISDILDFLEEHVLSGSYHSARAEQ